MNMAYIRFENTLRDLEDCYDHFEDNLSESEQEARNALLKLCERIAGDYDEQPFRPQRETPDEDGGSYL